MILLILLPPLPEDPKHKELPAALFPSSFYNQTQAGVGLGYCLPAAKTQPKKTRGGEARSTPCCSLTFSVSRRSQRAASFLVTSSCTTHLTIAEQDQLPRGVYADNLALSEAVAEGDGVGDESLPGKSCGRGRW